MNEQPNRPSYTSLGNMSPVRSKKTIPTMESQKTNVVNPLERAVKKLDILNRLENAATIIEIQEGDISQLTARVKELTKSTGKIMSIPQTGEFDPKTYRSRSKQIRMM